MMDPVLQDLQSVDLSSGPRRLPRAALLLLGLLSFLVLSFYVFTGFPLEPIIAGRLESVPFRGEVIQAEDFLILFENSTAEALRQAYFAEQRLEFSLCLLGEKEVGSAGDIYFISGLHQPMILQQSFAHVKFEPCPAETLILFHTHPYRHCAASGTDLRTLRRSQEKNPDLLMLVMCEPDRVSVYR